MGGGGRGGKGSAPDKAIIVVLQRGIDFIFVYSVLFVQIIFPSVVEINRKHQREGRIVHMYTSYNIKDTTELYTSFQLQVSFVNVHMIIQHYYYRYTTIL